MDEAQRASLLRYAEELDRRDQELAAALAELAALTDEVAALRARAVAVTVTLERLPAEIEAAAEEKRSAQVGLDEAGVALRAAEGRVVQLEASRRGKQEELDQARRDVKRAREDAHDVTARLERARAQQLHLLDDQSALTAEADGLVVAARSIAGRLQTAPRVTDSGKTEPAASVDELNEWGARARAALFVAHSSFASERERLLLEANALGVSAFGAQVGAVSIALVRRRLERGS